VVGCAVYQFGISCVSMGVVVVGMMSCRVERYGVDGLFKVFYIKILLFARYARLN
jgi:hypothetical protein